MASLFQLSTPGSSSVIDATVPAMSPWFISRGTWSRKVTRVFALSAAQVASNGFASRVAGIHPCISSCDLHRLAHFDRLFRIEFCASRFGCRLESVVLGFQFGRMATGAVRQYPRTAFSVRFPRANWASQHLGGSGSARRGGVPRRD